MTTWHNPTHRPLRMALAASLLAALSAPAMAATLDTLVASEIETRFGGDVEVRIFGKGSDIVVADALAGGVTFEALDVTARRDRFTAIALVPKAGGGKERYDLRGSLEDMRAMPVLTRAVMPGETIRESDIGWASFPMRTLRSNVIDDVDRLVGRTVRRPLQPGQLLNAVDVKTPLAVRKGATIAMKLTSGAMRLVAGGRALENGGVGDTIRVMNLASRQTVDAVVVSDDTVEVVTLQSHILASR
ncbi:flagellar basal body P-ring formation chaperone FlgA [Gimibacter soli]|uniref:Flagella basal body P-ring formation protein FlgA n=1 Tax=Gimibacter soli TaxID=3024400 RepID=A0AAE9XLC7_9PROT|nr:flagellar basal body P-ring formation chaperone FlgA [Gimibacter soli]WCL53037.1 flagellar basal body P-ring formation chaperone FlgA [Gimibacter soli]